jgi:hypothetical protein
LGFIYTKDPQAKLQDEIKKPKILMPAARTGGKRVFGLTPQNGEVR